MINHNDLNRFYFNETALTNKISLFLGSFFLTGFIKFAPGTTCTALSLPILLYINSLDIEILFIINLILVATSIYICDKVSKNTGIKDPKFIVLDEVVGMNISLFGIEISHVSVLLTFIVFRLLDITKPYPISYLDRKIKGGLGIVIDDVLAGVFTNLIVRFFYVISN